MKILGIDSARHTGLALITDKQDEDRLHELYIDVDEWMCMQLIAQNFERILKTWQPDVAFIENYALGMKKSPQGIILQIEIGTILRYVLTTNKIPWRLVGPKTLKKWVTGNGNAGKPDMADHALKAWGFKSSSDDLVDAYCLAKMGKWLLSRPRAEYPGGVKFGYGTLLNEDGDK
jgi:crossover junction endodeoxyribonuclease RuvC